MIMSNMFDLKKIFDESAEFLKTQWYRRHEALRYELDDLHNALIEVGKYDDEFTEEEIKIYADCEKEYNELLKEYEEGELYCLKAM